SAGCFLTSVLWAFRVASSACRDSILAFNGLSLICSCFSVMKPSDHSGDDQCFPLTLLRPAVIPIRPASMNSLAQNVTSGFSWASGQTEAANSSRSARLKPRPRSCNACSGAARKSACVMGSRLLSPGPQRFPERLRVRQQELQADLAQWQVGFLPPANDPFADRPPPGGPAPPETRRDAGALWGGHGWLTFPSTFETVNKSAGFIC